LPSEDVALDAPSKDVPIRSHDLATVNRGATALELVSPGFVDIGVGNVFEALEYPCCNFRTILLGKVEYLGE
jgi:hypothetical protein